MSAEDVPLVNSDQSGERLCVAAGFATIKINAIASQGMIHGGVKYALSGAWGGGSDAISTMPDTWRDCLQGIGKVERGRERTRDGRTRGNELTVC